MKSLEFTMMLLLSMTLGLVSCAENQPGNLAHAEDQTGNFALAENQTEIAPVPIPIPVPRPRHSPDLVTEGNLWAITGYRDGFRHDAYPVRHTRCYFFLGSRGTHDMYAWISTTFPRWWGFAEKEGDQVFQFGNFLPVVSNNAITQWWKIDWRGHSASQFELVSRERGRDVPRDMGTGHINANIEPGFARVFANLKSVRIGKCYPHIADRIKDVLTTDLNGDVEITDSLVDIVVGASDEIAERRRHDGATAESPFDDLVPLASFPGE